MGTAQGDQDPAGPCEEPLTTQGPPQLLAPAASRCSPCPSPPDEEQEPSVWFLPAWPPQLPQRRRAPSSRRHARGIGSCERRGAGNVPGRRRPPTSARAGGDTQKASALRELWARFRGAITPTPIASHPGRLRQSQAQAGVGELP